MTVNEMTSLLACLMVFARIRIVETNIVCYSCNTLYLPQTTLAFNCNDTLNPEGIPTCSGVTCMKRLFKCNGTNDECQKLHNVNRGTIVQRRCTDEVIDKDKCESKVMDKAIEVICFCNSNKCNDNPKPSETWNLKPFTQLTFLMTALPILFGFTINKHFYQ